ncbi:MAG: MBL fold metallo-hydrolase [Chloroflexi bacterium]|nr:MBL fold metallo-hydrolase [Chloroflexota bacterium]
MIEQILPDLYRMEIPLPKSPLKSLNSYLIKGDGRFLIIDTGMNREECLNPMMSYLNELGVDLNKTDFYITHLHADHLGLTATLARESSKVYFNWAEAAFLTYERQVAHILEVSKFYIQHGFPAEELDRAWRSHPGYKYSPRQEIKFTPVKEGDAISIGDYSFQCIHTPGHTPGHMCLYEAKKKVFVSGDHILFDITPNITVWLQMDDSLRHYLASLAKVSSLDVSLVLPGHRSLWHEHKQRIAELQEHHRSRLNEALAALEDGEKNAWQIAPYITWDIDCKSWEEFPAQQKWFAIGETVAHLRYLETSGKVQHRIQGDGILYGLV